MNSWSGQLVRARSKRIGEKAKPHTKTPLLPAIVLWKNGKCHSGTCLHSVRECVCVLGGFIIHLFLWRLLDFLQWFKKTQHNLDICEGRWASKRLKYSTETEAQGLSCVFVLLINLNLPFTPLGSAKSFQKSINASFGMSLINNVDSGNSAFTARRCD